MGDRSLPSQPLPISSPPPCVAQPPPHNTHSYRAQLLPTRLSRHRNRWQMAYGSRLRIQKELDSNLEQVNNRYRTRAARTAGKTRPGTPVVENVRAHLPLPKELLSPAGICHPRRPRESQSPVRKMSPHSDPQVPPLPGHKPGESESHCRTRVCARCVPQESPRIKT